MDERRLVEAAADFGLESHLKTLVLSRLNERREALMASAPHVWGLRVWINGVDIVLLDNRGFLCSTRIERLAFQLCQFESNLGNGALRALLQRPIVDPYAGIFLAPSPRRLPMPENKPEKGRRATLTPDAFKQLLEEM